MTKSKRGRYTLEFKQEAARLVESGQSQAAAARSLGVVEQTLGNWVRERRAGTLKGASSKPAVTAEQMENSRLRAELARVTMERDILGKATAGQPVPLTHDFLSHGFATLLPDGNKILFEGSEPGHASRNWVQDVTGGKPLPITPEGTVGKSVSPDGKMLVAVDAERKFWLYPIDGGQPRALPGVEPEEQAIRWSANGKDLFVANYDVIPAPITCSPTEERKSFHMTPAIRL